MVHELPEETQKRLPLNGCLIWSFQERYSIGDAVKTLTQESTQNMKEAERTLEKLLATQGLSQELRDVILFSFFYSTAAETIKHLIH